MGASAAVEGVTLDRPLEDASPDFLNLIDRNNFSGLFMTSLLICPQDAKPDNFVVTPISANQPYAKLAAIDNDMCFGDESKGQLRNVMYFFPQMDEPVTEEIRQRFCELEPRILLAQWLCDMYDQNQRFEQLINQGGLSPDSGLDIPIRLPEELVPRLLTILCQLKEALQSPDVTHQQIFELVYPETAQRYRALQENPNSTLLKKCDAIFFASCPPQLDEKVDKSCSSQFKRYSRMIAQNQDTQNSVSIFTLIENLLRDIPNGDSDEIAKLLGPGQNRREGPLRRLIPKLSHKLRRNLQSSMVEGGDVGRDLYK